MPNTRLICELTQAHGALDPQTHTFRTDGSSEKIMTDEASSVRLSRPAVPKGFS